MEIVSLLPLEQGTISGGVNTDSNTRCRTPGYFDLEGNPQSVQVNFAGTGGTLQISFIAFDANSNRVHSFYWHNSGTTIDISEYAENIAKFRCVIKFSNDATITPENITSAEVRYSKGWYVDEEDNLTNDELQTLLPSMEKPYPLSLWRVENGVLTNGLLAKFPADAGAFENASRLSRVAIPESVKTIGDSAFRGTALTVVRIAADCTFGEGSFPENCRILRYPAHTHGQITDGGGRVVLDRQGRRIYARRSDNG